MDGPAHANDPEHVPRPPSIPGQHGWFSAPQGVQTSVKSWLRQQGPSPEGVSTEPKPHTLSAEPPVQSTHAVKENSKALETAAFPEPSCPEMVT